MNDSRKKIAPQKRGRGEWHCVSEFTRCDTLLDGSEWLLVVKSCDQTERRNRMLESKRSGKFGRLKPRATGHGLVAAASFKNGKVNIDWKINFREPRHIAKHRNTYLITTVDQVVRISKSGEQIGKYTHPLFASLHTICVSSDENSFLVTSSGFDTLLELDIADGRECFKWVAWDHGFNPDETGVWLTFEPERLRTYRESGRVAEMINPQDYGEQGLLTAKRSAHPNVAIYDPYSNNKSILVVTGHDGNVYRIDCATCETSLVLSDLAAMPHGLKPIPNGWIVTNTTKGEFWLLDPTLAPQQIFSLRSLPGKIQALESAEWLQQCVPVGKTQFLCVDANRSIIAVDTAKREYSCYNPDSEWCVQDALLIAR